MSIEIDLSGNVALVTGANSPIGLAIASKLKKAGAELILAVHNNDDNVKSFTNSVPATILSANLRNPHEVEKLISETLEVSNQLDIIVNNAALQNVENLSEIDADSGDAVLETNLRSIHLVMRAALPALEKSENASSYRLLLGFTFTKATCVNFYELLGTFEVSKIYQHEL